MMGDGLVRRSIRNYPVAIQAVYAVTVLVVLFGDIPQEQNWILAVVIGPFVAAGFLAVLIATAERIAFRE